MVVLGISGRRRRAAAALSAGGRLVAASVQASHARGADAGYVGEALPRAAVTACLAAAGLAAADVTEVVIAEGGGIGAGLEPLARRFGGLVGGARLSTHRMSRLAAQARLGQVVAGDGTVLVADESAAAVVGGGAASEEPADLRQLLCLSARLAEALGLQGAGPCEAIPVLELLAGSDERRDRPWFAGLDRVAASPQASLESFMLALARAEADAQASLADADTVRVRAQRVRVELAHAFLDVLAGALARAALAAGTDTVLAGGVFASADFVARVRAAAGQALRLAPCASAEGAAVGAALALSSSLAGAVPESLALGAPVTEQDAKAVLENCRLDYLYEPRWPRLVERVSRVLERGKLVAWFQGPAEFGHPLHGSRSILCDPSSRYARDNVNEYLRHLPLSSPIPLSLPAGAAGCVDEALLLPWTFARTTVRAEWREALRGASDAAGHAHAHVLSPTASGPFAELLEAHRRLTGVPGLMNVPLGHPGEATAVTPRDAIRAAFASSADALVIHRFLVMKDFWQMRVDG